MGMYTELVFAHEIPKKELSHDNEQILSLLFGDLRELPKYVKIPEHPFFNADRWQLIGRCDSYYFEGDTQSTFRYDKIGDDFVITTRSNLKNYGDEIRLFLEWVWSVYHDKYDEFKGYYRYEEEEDPTLIYFDKNGVHYKRVESQVGKLR